MTQNDHRISLFYQHQQRDFFIIDQYSFDFNSFPRLEDSEGFTSFISYQLPVAENSILWFGPKLGYKNVNGQSEDFNLHGKRRRVEMQQENWYVLVQSSMALSTHNVLLEFYLHAGAVHVKEKDIFYEPDNSIFWNTGYERHWWPHILGGLALGFQI